MGSKIRNKKTGTVYVTVEIIEHAPQLAEVTTEAGSKYIVKTDNLEAVKGDSDASNKSKED